MDLQQKRLLAIIEYAQHSARMRAQPPSTVAGHGLFALLEEEAGTLPGLALNPDEKTLEDERWLVLARLKQGDAPAIADPLLAPWVAIKESTLVPPVLRTHALAASLAPDPNQPRKDGSADTVALAGFLQEDEIRQRFAVYLRDRWEPWALVEARVRASIAFYAKLFTIKQQLDEGIIDRPIELVWGVGMGAWAHESGKLVYPLITRLVDLHLDTTTGAIEVRPRDTPAKLELDWYAASDNPGVGAVEKAGREFFEKATETFSPFDRGTFESLLRTAVAYLDSSGAYLPDADENPERKAPKPLANLAVSDTWALFARPRSSDLFVQDLERFRVQIEDEEQQVELPDAIRAVVTEPATSNEEVELPAFRGVSGSDGSSEIPSANKQVRELYFPKAFNDEQIRIVQMLEVFDGVVVQGPPGTGKTHTIANVISHYLANGKRLLVTSMKDPALAVLRDQLPEDIRPLAISLLSTEIDGLKQFEFSVKKIATEIQALDRRQVAKDIEALEFAIDSAHADLARIDSDAARWARANLQPVPIDSEIIQPEAAARKVMECITDAEYLPDALGISDEFRPRFDDDQLKHLRNLRRTLGADLAYLGHRLPERAKLPDSSSVVQAHQDLLQLEKLKADVARGSVPPLRELNPQSLQEAAQLREAIALLMAKRAELGELSYPWIMQVRQLMLSGERSDLFQLLAGVGRETNQAIKAQKPFLERPVDLPAGLEDNAELVAAISKLAAGESAFGVRGLIGKSKEKLLLAQVRVLDRVAIDDAATWQHVAAYLDYRAKLRQLVIRWNALAPQASVGSVTLDLLDAAHEMARRWSAIEKIQSLIEREKSLGSAAAKLLPTCPAAQHIATQPAAAAQTLEVLDHHLRQHRLTTVWAIKEQFPQALEGCTGAVVDRLRAFGSQTLGNPEVKSAEIQAQWSMLMVELDRVRALSAGLNEVAAITELIKASGAPQWAAACQTPLASPIDRTVPDSWASGWQIRRLATYLDSVEARHVLTQLAQRRSEVAGQLSRDYETLVSRRTWLKLAENASPSVRSALAAYLTAIQKIGKGTGKRAVRYRRDARDAASAANPAVPCWIMPHHRVSESLPPEFGCFDLVVIDEASQSDLSALPALLRAKKVLIVGDDKQVSPEGVGLEEEKVRHLMKRFLLEQVDTYRPQLSPDRSLYDLFKVVFAHSGVMLVEHFRCVPAIIEYSKREFYDHQLRPLRIPTAATRLDPPLIDVYVEDGCRSAGDLNVPEADFIVQEICALVADPRLADRTIGVVSLLADKQATYIWERLTQALGPETMQRFHIACGDARTFQGKERDIMFLSMVAAPNERGAALSRDTFAQRFNVAASRARDRMYLVRSLELEDLSDKDILRRSLISHFKAPFHQNARQVSDLRSLCESPFESEIYDALVERGFRVRPQVPVGHFRIDMVVDGENGSRLAIECDGDRFHGPDQWSADMRRQRTLERAGWTFWRCFASSFIRKPNVVLGELLETLERLGIKPASGDKAPESLHTELRRVRGGGYHENSEDEPLAPVLSERVGFDDTSATSAAVALRPQPNEAVAQHNRPSEREGAKPVAAVEEGARERARELEQPYSPDVLAAFVDEQCLVTQDLRHKKGLLWVNLDDAASPAARQLKRWGFQYKAGRGWWRK